ncbi:MAG: hypothetical protein N2690_12395, partial [Rhodocyclaceae bacterium]|nr:hypothetical protein [Rhodocyclaceae bacterium]
DHYSPENKGRLMGSFAEDCAQHYGFSRQDQDAFAIASTQRAQRAGADGSFDWEIAPVTVASKKGDVTIKLDEQPGKAQLDKIPALKPAFKKDGTVTAANSSSISDGAAALVLMREAEAQKRGLAPIARIVGIPAAAPGLAQLAATGAITLGQGKPAWAPPVELQGNAPTVSQMVIEDRR